METERKESLDDKAVEDFSAGEGGGRRNDVAVGERWICVEKYR